MMKKVGEEVVEQFDRVCDTCGEAHAYVCQICGLDVCVDCVATVAMSGEISSRTGCKSCPEHIIAANRAFEEMAARHEKERSPVLHRLFELQDVWKKEKQGE